MEGKRSWTAGYVPPAVADYGRLNELTGSAHLLFAGAASQDPGFSGAVGGAVNGTAGNLASTSSSPGAAPQSATLGSTSGPGVTAHHAVHGTHHAGAGGGGAAGGTGSSGTIPGPERLPFTGFAAGLTGAIGAGLMSVGAALRRLVRPRGARD